MRNIGTLIGAIDQGTSSTRFLVFVAQTGDFVTYHQLETNKILPHEGWVEQDPIEIYDTVVECMEVVYEKLIELDINPTDMQCTGLTNQRESTIVWDKYTGLPLYNCIIWLDNRTSDLVDQILDDIPGRDINYFKNKTGLPISTYFSALKLRWLINNVPEVKKAIIEERLMFGTVDCWLLWKLTGLHLTDVTNASRTLLMDIETLNWDPYLCDFFKIPMNILPKIMSSSEYFGKINKGSFKNLPITGVIGDQSAALVGQKCFSIGQAKVTFGTGCFLIQNIGPGPVHGALKGVSKEAKTNLITTVAYRFGSNPAVYALEGSIAIAGAAVTWLRDNLEIINNYSEVETIATQDQSSGGLFFVPAFQGLYAPHWDANATGTIIGLSQFSRKCHLVRATLEGVAFQCNDIISIMRNDGNGIKVDGGMSSNQLLCQILADISGCVILRPKMTEATALGAAMVAAFHYGIWNLQDDEHRLNNNTNLINGDINVHEDHNGHNGHNGHTGHTEHNEYAGHNGHSVHSSNVPIAIPNGFVGEITRRLSLANITRRMSTKAKISSKKFDVFRPNLDNDLRFDRINTWKDAVLRSQKWIRVDKHEQKRVDYKRLSSLPFMLYVLLSLGIHILSQNSS